MTAIFTVLLLASSVTIWLAERSQRRGQAGAMRGWLFATIALGVAFLAGQGLEYAKLIAEGVTISANLFGTTFYMLTGFHGLHVFGGLVALVILFGLALARANAFDDPHSTALETTSLYWHFVDVDQPARPAQRHVVDHRQRHPHRDDVAHAARAKIEEEALAVAEFNHDAGAGL